MEKEVLQNNKATRCDSCGNPKSCKKYNNANLCISCLRMDQGGTPRDSLGKIFSLSDKLVIGYKDKPRKRKL